MNKLFKLGIFFIAVSFSVNLKAEQPNALGFEPISPAQPTQDTSKVEVIEFFWYGCPHCYSFEPVLNQWLANKPDNVQFIRIPAVFSKRWAKHAKAYFTAEALGIVDKVHGDFFDAIQNKKQKLETEDQLAEFFTAHGIDETEFRNAYNSFMVDAKMRQAKSMAPRYGVTGVPAVIINGKYKTNGPLARGHQNMITVMNRLIQEESN